MLSKRFDADVQRFGPKTTLHADPAGAMLRVTSGEPGHPPATSVRIGSVRKTHGPHTVPPLLACAVWWVNPAPFHRVLTMRKGLMQAASSSRTTQEITGITPWRNALKNHEVEMSRHHPALPQLALDEAVVRDSSLRQDRRVFGERCGIKGTSYWLPATSDGSHDCNIACHW